jgi:hypothetical protein
VSTHLQSDVLKCLNIFYKLSLWDIITCPTKVLFEIYFCVFRSMDITPSGCLETFRYYRSTLQWDREVRYFQIIAFILLQRSRYHILILLIIPFQYQLTAHILHTAQWLSIYNYYIPYDITHASYIFIVTKKNCHLQSYSLLCFFFFFVSSCNTGWKRRGWSSGPSWINYFHFSMSSRLAQRPTQLPIKWVQGALSLVVIQPGHEDDHSPPTSVRVKKKCLYIRLPIHLHGKVLN